MANLETRVEDLSTSLAECRAQFASVRKENASLRDQNSFLRGVISEKEKVAIDMPPIVPTPTTHEGSRAAPGGAGGGGGGVTLSGLSASVACAAAAAIGCVAFSRFEGRGGDGAPAHGGRGVGLGAGAGVGGMGGGRTLLSVGDYDEHLPQERSTIAFGGVIDGGVIEYLLKHNGWRLLKLALALEFCVLLVFVVAPWVYKTAMRYAAKRGTRGRSRGLALGTMRVREESSRVFYHGLRRLSSGGGGGLMLKRL